MAVLLIWEDFMTSLIKLECVITEQHIYCYTMLNLFILFLLVRFNKNCLCLECLFNSFNFVPVRQCAQITRLFAHHLSIYDNENLPNFFAKIGSKFGQKLKKPKLFSKKLEILAKEGSFAKSGHAVVRLEEIVVQRIHQNIFCAIHFSLH